jgi:hypothetical protein
MCFQGGEDTLRGCEDGEPGSGRRGKSERDAEWVICVRLRVAWGLTDIARCFKAKDTNLVRANQFVRWAKTGTGANPVEGF